MAIYKYNNSKRKKKGPYYDTFSKEEIELLLIQETTFSTSNLQKGEGIYRDSNDRKNNYSLCNIHDVLARDGMLLYKGRMRSN